MNGSEHLDTERVYDLLDGRLDAVAEGAAQAHLLRCDPCRRLERECAGVVESLRWYGTELLQPPADYWEAFWARWSPSAESPAVVRLPAPRRTAFPLAPALAVAAVLALLAGLWWTERPAGTETSEFQAAEAPPLRQAVAGSGWADDYARFEQMTIAVGGIGPVSKGIALASLAEEP